MSEQGHDEEKSTHCSNLIVRSPSLFRLGEYGAGTPGIKLWPPFQPHCLRRRVMSPGVVQRVLPLQTSRVRNTDPDLSAPWPFASDTCCRHESTSWRGNPQPHTFPQRPHEHKGLELSP